MIKTSSIFVLKIRVLSLLVFCGLALGISEAAASERGIGVTPGKIEIGEEVQWPYTTSLFVTNLSEEEEFFEITIEADDTSFISVSEGRFALEGLEQKQVFLTFDNPGKESLGIIKISATRVSGSGFVTGTGIKVPFAVVGSGAAGKMDIQDEETFLAGVADVAGDFTGRSPAIGLLVIFASLVALWYFSIFARRYFFSK